MPSIKSATGAFRADDASNPFTITLPSGLAAGDPLFVLLVGTSNGLSATTPANWATVLTAANFGSGSYVMIKRTGGWQAADGTSLSITVAATMNLTWAAFGLDGTLYKPDTFTVGTVTARGSSVTTNTAVAAGTGVSDTLVVSAEKASAHTGAPDAPSVSPATTLGVWAASSTASTPSAYAGIYGGAPGDRTITYTTASANGAAWQIALSSASNGPLSMQPVPYYRNRRKSQVIQPPKSVAVSGSVNVTGVAAAVAVAGGIGVPSSAGGTAWGMAVSGAEVVPNDSQPATNSFSNVTTGTVNTNYRYEGTTSTTTHNHLTFAYLVSRGWKGVKLCYRWERLTKNASALTPGTLNSTEMALVDTEIAEAASQGLSIVIDLHNYGQYYADGAFVGQTAGTGYAVHLGETAGGVAFTTAFATFWGAIAARYLSNPAVTGFHIMNEPNGTVGGTPKLTKANWYAAAQAAVNAIRAVDTTGRYIIRVGGWAYSSCEGWVGTNQSTGWITDTVAPQNIWYEAHHYFDPNGAGDYTSQNYAAAVTDAQNKGFTATYNGVTYPDAVYSKVLTALDLWNTWLTTNGVKGIIGEIGTPDSNYVSAGDVVSWTNVLAVYLAHATSIGIPLTAWSCGEIYSGFNTALQIYGASNFFTSGVDNPGPTPQVAPTWETALAAANGTVTGVAAPVTVQGGVGTPSGSAHITGVAAPVTVQAGSGVATGVGSSSVNVSGVAAPVTVHGGAGAPSGSENITGVAAPVTVQGGVGAPSGSENITGVAAPVTVQGGVGTPAGASNVTGVAAPLSVQGGVGTPPSGSSNITGVAAPVTVHGGAGAPSGSENISGVAALVTVQGGAGIPSGSGHAAGVAAPVTVQGGLGVPAGPGNITGVAAPVTVHGGAGAPSGSENITGVAAPVAVQGGVGTPSGSGSGAVHVSGVAAPVTVQGGVGTPSGSSTITGVAASLMVGAGAGTGLGDAHVTGVASHVTVQGAAGTFSASANAIGAASQVTVRGGAGAPSGAAQVAGAASQVMVRGGAGSFFGPVHIPGIATHITVTGGVGVVSASANIKGVAARITTRGGAGAAAGITPISANSTMMASAF